MRDLDRYQSEYVKTYGFEAYLVRYRRQQVLASMGQYPHRHVLEVGCGLEPLVQYVTHWDTYTIVEPGSVFAARARELGSTAGSFSVHEATIEEAAPKLAGRHFDFIVVSSLLHEVTAPLELLVEVRKLCDRDTIVHVNVPNARSLHNRLAVHMGLIPDVFARSALHQRMQRTSTFDSTSLAALAAQAGFSIESSGSYFLKPFTHEQMQQMLDQGIIGEAVLDALFKVSHELPDLGAEIYMNLSTS